MISHVGSGGDAVQLMLVIDIILVVAVLFMTRPVLRIHHPMLWYLVWHCTANTARLFSLVTGAELLYFSNGNFAVVTPEEILRASFWNGLALVLFAAGVMLAHGRAMAPRDPRRFLVPGPGVIDLIAKVVFPLGILCFLLVRFVPRATLDGTGLGSYITVAAMWPVQILCMLIFFRGFRTPLILILSVLMLLTAVQGYHRFMVILPALFLGIFYALDRRIRYPILKMSLPAIPFLMVVPYIKNIGALVQDGAYGDAAGMFFGAFVLANETPGSPTNFLDQFAAALTLIDGQGTFWLGATYVSLLLLPIPRALWAEKPSLGQHVIDIATIDRPFDREGRIITYLGEAYVNFAEFGMIIIPLLVSYLFTRLYMLANTGPERSLLMLTLLFFLPASIQMYRDGIGSIILFGLIFNAPLIFAYVLARNSRNRLKL